MAHLAMPTAVLGRRELTVARPRPTLAPRWAPTALPPAPRCEDCLTTTVTLTHYVDEYGQSTTCTTTEFQTAFQTNTVPPLPTPTLPVDGQWATIYHTQTSTINAAASPTPYPRPHGGIVWSDTHEGAACQCELDWVKVFLGGLPLGVPEVIASLAFFFPFLLFFLVALVRLKKYAGDKDMFFFLVPLTIFLALMLSATATRAYAANNDSTPHFLAQHVIFAIAVPVLLDVALQLHGLLSKRVIPNGWIDASSLFLRLLNLIALVLYAVAAGSVVTFVNGWEMGFSDCSSHSITRILILNTVANVIEVLVLIMGCIFLFLARWKFRMETGVLVIQYLLYAAFLAHFLWRAVHDVSASNAWRDRLDDVCAPPTFSAGSNDAMHPLLTPIDWAPLHASANKGMNSAAPFWLLGILPIFIAATLLMAANLPLYISAVPPPIPEADSVRYKLCYNEDTKKMEFQRLDNPGGPLLPNGEQLYELVRDDDGDGWAVREARTPTVLPTWQNVTFKPWYR